MDKIDELWMKMKHVAHKNGLNIVSKGDKEVIVDKVNKQFFVKCRAGDLQEVEI